MGNSKGLPENIQVSKNHMMFLFRDEMYLYDRLNRYSHILLEPIEKSVVQAVNTHHNLSLVWKMLCEQFELAEMDIEAHNVFTDYVTKLWHTGALEEGTTSFQIYGEEGKAYPAFMSLELTNKCNLKCTHCYKEADSVNNSFINKELALKILSQIAGKVYCLDLTGGEATLHPDFQEIVAAATGVGRLSLLTNGSRLAQIPETTLTKFYEIQVSVYGDSNDVYKQFTKSGLFEEVCAGINRIVSLGIRCTVAMQLRPDIVENLENYIECIARLGVKRIRFGMSQKIGRNAKGESLWDTSHECFDKCIQKLASIRKDFPEIVFSELSWEDEPSTYLENKVPSKIVCDAGRQNIAVSERGRVRPCLYMPQQYFEKLSWEDYYNFIEKGEIYNFSAFIPECIAGLQKEGRSIYSICSHGFE